MERRPEANCNSLAVKTLLALTCGWPTLWGQASNVRFIDIANDSGLSQALTYGNPEKNLYILETTGTGVAIFDYDLDGDNDIYFANGTTLEADRKGQGPAPLLYRNDGELKFTAAAAAAGIRRSGW